MSKEIWTFKYEPQKFDDIILNDKIKSKLKKALEEVPNLMLVGPPGVGKGTFTNIFIKETGFDHMWINASDETGIDAIRDKVKSFSTALGITPLKIVVLNEADALSRGASGAQKMLKQLIEDVQRITRFIFLTNDESLMMNELMSRCQVIRVDNPPGKEVYKFVADILKKENVKFDQKMLVNIVKKCHPDIRSTILTVQQNVLKGKLVSDEGVYESMWDGILKSMKEGDLDNIRVTLKSNTINYAALYKHLFENIDGFKSPGDAIIMIGEYMYRDTTVAIKEINFMAMVVNMMKQGII
jgi:replication factor C small subunit